MINYTWTTNVITNPSVTIEGTTYEDVVEEITWRCTGIDSDTDNTAFEEQTWEVPFENPATFVSFDSLNTDLVVSWIMTDDEKDNQIRQVNRKIDRLNNTKEL